MSSERREKYEIPFVMLFSSVLNRTRAVVGRNELYSGFLLEFGTFFGFVSNWNFMVETRSI